MLNMKKTLCKITLFLITAFIVATFGVSTFGGVAYADSEISLDSIASCAKEVYYADDLLYSEEGSSVVDTEIINYATKSVITYMLNNSFPNYYNTNSLLYNACANVAGSNIIGYYDRYYIDLIPACSPGVLRTKGYSYYAMTVDKTKKQDVINSLYISMSTNNPIAGTSQAQYKNGLASYVTGKNLSISYNTVMSNAAFNMNMADTQLRNGNPISLFLSGYNFSTINDNGTTATITKVIYSGNHIAITYGYQQVNYYNSAGALIKSNLYLYVATGMQAPLQLYIINNNGTLNDAEAAHIY